MTASTDDTQRELEQRALRNVRGLVDRMESAEEAERRIHRRTIAVVAAAVLALVAFLAFIYLKNQDARPSVPAAVDPAKLPPIQAGPRQ